MRDAITQQDVRELLAAGYAVVDENVSGTVTHVTVADPVNCLSGGKRWTEIKHVTLRSRPQVSRFLTARS
ncbi:hypothetical protein DP57_5909 [Burkholderia pseudomallei]|uniref:hypothetical protein n=1 Tax=Burkholderia pseudomallei TaxID=28450 RepID=UPI00050DA2B5|nr:hypothetical protein [Burkholderia pseudomallei]KGC70197.1 hypothetical protein DP57_5909 [Burkholderia pseudomallei]